MTGMNPNFKINLPTSSGPLTTYESDEESFVVLGKSLVDNVDYHSTEIESQNGSKTIEEARKIIDEEIRSLDQNSKEETIVEGKGSVQNGGVTSQVNPFQDMACSIFEASNSKMNSFEEKSSLLNTSLKNLSIAELQNFAKTAHSKERNKMTTSILEVHVPNNLSVPNKIEEPAIIPPEDLQKQITEIIEENRRLKETVKQNCNVMQEQCNNISAWQDEVKKVHEAHKTKLWEAKQHIDKLTDEKKQVFFEKNEADKQIAALQEELNMTRTKLAEIQIVQTEFQQSRSALYAQNNTLKADIQKLQQTIEEMQKVPNKSDEMYALETQLDIYKADFEAERRAKESIKEEKEKLIEDLQSLQRRNQQLQERIEMLSDRDFVMYESRDDREGRNREERSSSELLACPKCNSAFPNMSALQNHIFICIK